MAFVRSPPARPCTAAVAARPESAVRKGLVIQRGVRLAADIVSRWRFARVGRHPLFFRRLKLLRRDVFHLLAGRFGGNYLPLRPRDVRRLAANLANQLRLLFRVLEVELIFLST